MDSDPDMNTDTDMGTDCGHVCIRVHVHIRAHVDIMSMSAVKFIFMFMCEFCHAYFNGYFWQRITFNSYLSYLLH